jgi:hypothetical protein
MMRLPATSALFLAASILPMAARADSVDTLTFHSADTGITFPSSGTVTVDSQGNIVGASLDVDYVTFDYSSTSVDSSNLDCSAGLSCFGVEGGDGGYGSAASDLIGLSGGGLLPQPGGSNLENTTSASAAAFITQVQNSSGEDSSTFTGFPPYYLETGVDSQDSTGTTWWRTPPRTRSAWWISERSPGTRR